MIDWLTPLAAWGLLALAIPLAVHWLARPRARRERFPSLRFLHAPRSVAVRRHRPSDWPLLAVRLLVVATAVAALAGPVVVSHARRDAWNTRVARAIVVENGATADAESLASEAARGSVVSRRITAPTWPDGLREASEWLRHQPPAAREIVIVGDVREGALTTADIERVPAFVGVRVLPTVQATRTTAWTEMVVRERNDGAVVSVRREASFGEEQTRVRDVELAAGNRPAIDVLAAPDHQAHAGLLLAAVMAEGLVLTHPGRSVVVRFAGAPDAGDVSVPTAPWMRAALSEVPGSEGGARGDTLVASLPMAATDLTAAGALQQVLAAAFREPRPVLEAPLVTPAVLAAWSRAPGPAPADAPLRDEGDRRWVWGAALVWLGIEHLVRRRRAAGDGVAAGEVSSAGSGEVRHA